MKMMLLTRLYDTNAIYGYSFTNGKQYIAPLLSQDNYQMRLTMGITYELQNLIKQDFGSIESIEFVRNIVVEKHQSGQFPRERLLEHEELPTLRFLNSVLSTNNLSKNSRKNDLNFLDASLIIIAKRLKVDIVSTENRLNVLYIKGMLPEGVNIINPYPDGFEEIKNPLLS